MDSPIFVLKHHLNDALWSNIDYYTNRAYGLSDDDKEKTLFDLMEQKAQVEQAIKLLENYKPQSTKTCDMMGFEVIGFDEAETFEEKCRISKLHFQRMNDMVNDSEREFNTMLSQTLSKKISV